MSASDSPKDRLFVRRTRRLVLDALVSEEGRVWTRTELAIAAGQHPKARIDLHLDALQEMGLVTRTAGGFRVDFSHPVAPPLRDLLDALRNLPD